MRRLGTGVAALLTLLAWSSRAPAAPQRPSSGQIEVTQSAAGETGETAAAPRGPVPDIEVAYRAFASGELEVADRMLSDLVERRPSPAAFLLRGCTRFTRAMLSRNGRKLHESARADVRHAYQLNPSLWLDPARFSPRVIAFVDSVRREQP